MDIGQVEQLLGILKVFGIHVVFVGVYVIRVSDSPTMTFQGHSNQTYSCEEFCESLVRRKRKTG